MNRQNHSVLALACCTLVALTGCGGSSNKDATIPVISLEGSASISLEAGTAYTDAGATATDNIDGAITGSIVTVNPVDINTVGTYTVTYNVSDAAGNAAAAVPRTVVVVEPVLTGFFTDSAVEGLTYTTDTQSGVTDLNGAFTYQAGETVVFSIGDFVLGESAVAAPEMTPLNLIPDAFLPTTRNELSPLLRNKTINTAEVIAFRKLSNMLTFLQALDYDKDASNGITIADGMGMVLEGVSIDFAAEFTEFKVAIPLKRVMSTAVTQNLISSGFIKNRGQALNHFYQAQEISHSFKARATRSYDGDGDGDADSITTYTYDTDGNRLNYSYDNNGDGDANEIVTFTYDTDGNRLAEISDNNGDGEPNSIYTYTYDTDGNELTDSYDSDADGEPNRIFTYTYDTDGNRSTHSYDFDADGYPNSIYTSTYDTDGNRLTYSYDTDADGEPNSIYTATYDTDGNQLAEISDNNGDGEPNSIRTYTYDTDGNRLTNSYDNNGDNRITTSTYDTYGNRLTYSYDSDADGEPNTIETSTYDTDGNRLTNSYDSDGDDEPNSIYTYTYDTDGNRLTYSYDNNGDGYPISITTYTYDTDGNQLIESYDSDGDGKPNSILTFTLLDSNILANIFLNGP